MLRLNIHEAKTHLSKYLKRLAKGESIILCKRNNPIAEIRPLSPKAKKRRPIGLARNEFTIPKDFFKPLPDKIEKLFYKKK
ncbi:MAG: type II toxin-antitoxin system Phd/YefM family antitoxin [Nitrospinota bacterium]